MWDEMMLILSLLRQSGLWLLVSVLNVLFLYRVWRRFVQIRRGWFWRVILFCTLGATSVTVIWIGDPNLLYALLAFFLLGLLCTQGQWMGRLAIIMIFFSLMMAVNGILDTYLELLDPYRVLGPVLRPVIYGGLYLLLKKRLPEQPPNLSRGLWKLMLGLAAMPLCALIAVVLLTSRRYESLAVNAVGLNQGLVVLPFALLTALMLLLAISILADHERLERSNQLAGLREAYYQSLQQQEIQVRRLRHDLRNHLTVLQGLLEAGDSEKTLDYLRQMSDSKALRRPRRFCDNETANVVLSSKIEDLEQEGILADVAVSLPQDLPVSDTDLCALLGNALDNAIEGSHGAAEQKVTVRCKADKGLFMLQVRNPVGGCVRADLSTTKPDKTAHGFGIPGMREIAERYRGTLEAGVQNGQFELTVCLPITHMPDAQ